MAAAMVAVPMVVTVAMRTPARMVGAASGSSTCHSSCRPVIPMAMADSRTAASTPRIPASVLRRMRKQRVEHQRDDRGPLADASDERNRDQESEQREAGDGLHHVGEAEQQASAGGAAREQNAERNPDRRRDGHGRQHQHEMLAGQAAPSPAADKEGSWLSSIHNRLSAPQERARFRAARFYEFGRCRQNFQSATMQQRDFGAEAQRFPHVVGDEDGGLAQAVAQFQELVLQFDACYRIERAERFVEKQELRIGGQRARHAHALALSARELARIAIQKLRRLKAHLIQQFGHVRAAMRSGGQPFKRGTRPTFSPMVKCGNRPTS